MNEPTSSPDTRRLAPASPDGVVPVAGAGVPTGPAPTERRNRSLRRFMANRMAVAGAVVVALLVIVALLAPVLAPYHPIQDIFSGTRGNPPSTEHWMGHDHLGRDLFSRVLYGTRIALLVGILSSLIAVVIGVIVGAAAGYFGGRVDAFLSLLIDTLMAFPLIALLILLAAVLGPSLSTTIVVIGFTVWSRYARVVRAEVMSLRERDFVSAARAMGARSGRILLRHVIPNVLSSVIVLASLQIGGIIILESALSFLGLGVRPPTPTWGGILADGRAFILRYPHIAIFPGIMIVITVLSFNFLGDGLRDALDPHQRSS